jgi:phospholipid/cholesterol/gamma-HCH transport system substrate-binding protein
MTKNIELRVGLFIVTTILLLSIFVGYVAYKKGVFSKVNTITFSSKSGEGFSEGMPLVFAGFEIGSVQSLELNEQGVVLIKIKIPERHIKWTRKDSIFILDRPLIGKPKIVVYTDNFTSPVISTDTIPEIFPVDSIDEAIQKVQPILTKIDTILENAATITDNLAGKDTLLEMAVGDKKSVQSLNSLLKKSNDIGYRLDTILARADSLTAKTDKGMFGSKDGVLVLIRSILIDIIAKLETLDDAVADVPQITTNVSQSTGSVEKLQKDITATINSTNELLKDIDRLLPLKKESEIKLP